jgi:general stress protein 26
LPESFVRRVLEDVFKTFFFFVTDKSQSKLESVPRKRIQICLVFVGKGRSLSKWATLDITSLR